MEPAIEMYLESLRAFCPGISDNEIAAFASRLTVKEANKKDIFLQSGKTQKALGFIAQGLVRSFYMDEQGNERTVGFYTTYDYATHYHAFLLKQPSRYTIQCLEPTTFVCLSFEDLQWAYGQSLQFERYGRLIAEEVLKRQQERIERFLFQTAEERYLDFTEHQSALFNRISLSHLCSFLGIERQTLTRIRQKLARH